MKPMSSLVLCIMVLFCGAAPVAAQDLVVSAAGSLTHAFNALKTEFEKERPGVRIIANYAASGSLFRQMEQGAPVDVFASADMKWMDMAIKAGLIRKQDVAVFAQNAIVLAVPTQNPAAIEAVADLADARVRRIAVGTPTTVPAGYYAMRSLQELGLWDALQPKFIFAENVRQALDYIVRGEVDAGIFFSTDAKQAGERVRVAAPLPMKAPARYPIASLTRSQQQALANEFTRFVLSERGQEIVGRFGFEQPE